MKMYDQSVLHITKYNDSASVYYTKDRGKYYNDAICVKINECKIMYVSVVFQLHPSL